MQRIEEAEEHALVQGRTQLKRGAGRRGEGEPAGGNPEEAMEEDKPTTSWTPPGPAAASTGKLMRTGIMTTVENCVVWKSLKSLNLKQREKLLAALQETVEGNSGRRHGGMPSGLCGLGKEVEDQRDQSPSPSPEPLGQHITPFDGDNCDNGSVASTRSHVILVFVLHEENVEEEWGNGFHQNTDGDNHTRGRTPTPLGRSPGTANDDDRGD